MGTDSIQTTVFILLCVVAGIMIGLAFFKGVHFEAHTWTKVGIAFFVTALGGYFWWARG